MTIGIFVVACVVLLVLFVAHMTVLPWVGHIVIKILTFGKIDLGWRPDDVESELAEKIGFFVLLLVAGVVAGVVRK